MPDITDYIFDTTLLEQMLKSLKDSFNIHVSVVDTNEDVVSVGDDVHEELEFKRYYPFKNADDIGGLRCTACDENTIDNAEDQIQTYLSMINTLVEKEVEAQQMGNEIIEISEQINFLFSLANKMSGTKKMIALCEMLVKEISTKIDADSSFISILDEEGNTATTTFNISEEEVAVMKKEVVFTNATKKTDTSLSTTSNGMSVIISPVNTKEGMIGLMAYFRNKEKRFFVAYEKKFVSIINNTVAYSLETLRLYENLKNMYYDTVKALTAAIDAKDPYTHGHSHRVAKYSVVIAKEMDLHDDEIIRLEQAAYMHDLGKIGISDAVLLKTGKLSNAEYNEIKKHPVFTEKILVPIKLPKDIIQAAVQHHEKIDGSGYPKGLSGDQIILSARILAAADVFDALTSNRSYRKAMVVDDALKILVDSVGSHFDKNVVLALIKALDNGKDLEELTDVYSELSFADLTQLKRFITSLSECLIEDDLAVEAFK